MTAERVNRKAMVLRALEAGNRDTRELAKACGLPTKVMSIYLARYVQTKVIFRCGDRNYPDSYWPVAVYGLNPWS